MKPTKSIMTVLKQAVEPIPAYLVPKLARKHGIDKQSRSFSPWSHVVSQVHAQLAHSLSLNDVCDDLHNHRGALRTLRGATPPSRNGLSHANRTRNADMAEELFWSTLAHLQAQAPHFGMGRKYVGFPRRFKCDLYKGRWGVEVFFKQIRQTLQLADFLGHNEQAIRWQIWTALLTYLLLRFIAFQSQWDRSFARLFTVLRSVLWDRFDMYSVLAFCGTAPRPPPLHATPGQAYLPGFTT